MELLFGSCKRCYARRILNHIIQDKVLNKSDLINGFEKFTSIRLFAYSVVTPDRVLISGFLI